MALELLWKICFQFLCLARMMYVCFIPIQIQVFWRKSKNILIFISPDKAHSIEQKHQNKTYKFIPLKIHTTQETPHFSLSPPNWCKWLLCTWISSMVWTMNVSCRSSMAPSIQLLKGAARLAYSRYNWSIVSSSFSVLCARTKRNKRKSGEMVGEE